MLDSLKHVKTLEKSGFSRSQAESQVQVLTTVIGGVMVTKEEFRNGLTELQKDVRFEMAEFRSELKSDISKLREELKSYIDEKFKSYSTTKEIKEMFVQSEQRMTIRLGKMMATMFGIAIAALTLILSLVLPLVLN